MKLQNFCANAEHYIPYQGWWEGKLKCTTRSGCSTTASLEQARDETEYMAPVTAGR